MRVLSTPFNFPSIGCCIYCCGTRELTDEHIIPESLAGQHIFAAASCKTCANITRKFEGHCATFFGPLRIAYNYPFNDPPPAIPIQVTFPDRSKDRYISIDKCPGVSIPVPILPVPGILAGATPDHVPQQVKAQPLAVTPLNSDERLDRFIKEGGLSVTVKQMTLGLNSYMRLFAKIAHGFAIAWHGPKAFRPILTEYILGRQSPLFYVVGCRSQPIPHPQVSPPDGRQWNHLWQVGILSHLGVDYVLARIQLFWLAGLPVYDVIVGYASPQLVQQEVGKPDNPPIEAVIFDGRV